MRYDRILFLLMSIFFIIFAFVIRYVINGIIKKSNKRTEENKQKEIKKGNIISWFLLFIALYWSVLFLLYNKLF